MMRKTRLLLFLLACCGGVWAQDSTLVTVKAGSSIGEVLTTTQIFLYPQFIPGNVFFRDETKASAPMNYSRLFGQLLFIDGKSDTLALEDEKNIKFVTLSKDTFYYDKEYVRLIANTSSIKLGEKQTWQVADIRKIGSHNRPATTFAVTSYSTLTDRLGKTYDLVLNEDLVLRKETNYYFGNRYNHFVPANKKNLLLLFPKEQTGLLNYLNDNKVDFRKKEDLQKLLQFLAQHY